jgi:hypothetical protein
MLVCLHFDLSWALLGRLVLALRFGDGAHSDAKDDDDDDEDDD